MLSEIFQRFIQKRPVATMVLILLENFLNADKLDRCSLANEYPD